MKKLIFIKFYLIFSFVSLFACSKDDSVEGTSPPVIAALVAPVAKEASSLLVNGFFANWNSVTGAEKYLFDLATDVNFSNTLPDYNAKEVTGSTLNVPNLTGTIFYYRLRAKRGTEISAYSNVIKVEILGQINTTQFLKTKVNGDFLVGVAVNPNFLSGNFDTTIKREFTSITAENEMKMRPIFTSQGNYNWTNVDNLLNYATLNNLNVHGHALIWHESMPDWLSSFSGTNAEFEQIIKDYITAVVTHCKGKVKSWDVVNEAIDDSGNARNSIFRQKMGADYVKKCFQFARDAANAAPADPNLLLFYNDYGTSDNIAKQNAVYTLVDQLKTANLIDGVGLQMHVNYNSPSKQQITDDTNKIVSRNLKVHFSEVDIRVNSSNPQITSFTNDRKLAQKIKMREITQVFKALPTANKYAISVWGFRDSDSWIINLFGRPDWPLLFDNSFAPKHMHTGFLEGLD